MPNENTEEALDQIHQRGVRWDVVKVDAGMALELVLSCLVFEKLPETVKSHLHYSLERV
jgi:hypothetical protein